MGPFQFASCIPTTLVGPVGFGVVVVVVVVIIVMSSYAFLALDFIIYF
jgi:hypothetical protein